MVASCADLGRFRESREGRWEHRRSLPYESRGRVRRLELHLRPDVVHVLADGRIVESGGPALALELEAHGYAWVKDRVAPQAAA